MNAEVPSGRRSTTNTTASNSREQVEKRYYSIFEVALDFFDSCRLLESPSSTIADALPVYPTLKTLGEPAAKVLLEEEEEEDRESKKNDAVQRFSCNTCRVAFDSLQDQRSHFKADFHRFNIKLSLAGKDTVKEEDFDESTSDSLFKDYDISSISGSEDEDDKESVIRHGLNWELGQSLKNKIFVQLHTGEKFSVWKCLLLDEAVKVSFENEKSAALEDDCKPCLTEREVTEKLRYLIHEPRDNTHLRVLLLARGGHFAGCVFDGNSVVAHKTFHRYVIRAKSGKKQSSKDSSGKMAHSAGASIRRYNELALKKDIRELLGVWKPYFDAASCVFIHAPSNNRQLLFDGEKPYFSCLRCSVRNIPLTVRRPTLKEARRLYNVLTQISFEADEKTATIFEGSHSTTLMIEQLEGSSKEILVDSLDCREIADSTIDVKRLENLSLPSESESEITSRSTPLHEASKSGNAEKVLELLEQGLDPCIKDERGWTPYMLATEKDVRDTFRRFMASNLDKWDWQAAKVPSPLTKEMEESQAAKQAEKDARRKARAKELKKLRKAKEKKAQAEAAQIAGTSVTENSKVLEPISKEEQLRREQAAEREKRAAAAEKRMAALQAPVSVNAPSISQPNNALSSSGDIKCSCCHSSLAGKVPFHRYNYKYCSTSCMHVHREILEDDG